MTCERIELPNGAVGHVCARGRRSAPTLRCACGARADLLAGRARRAQMEAVDG